MKKSVVEKPKILFFDIETTPNLAYIWGKYEQTAVGFTAHSHLLSFSAKWKGGKTITKGLIDYPNYEKDRHNDLLLTKELWGLLNEADIVVAHNGKAFDTKKVNARFSYHKLPPPSPYKVVDTKEMSKRYFNFTSNSLDDISQYLGLGKKMPHSGFELWVNCMAGVPEAWREMKKYNAYDTVLLEKVYDRLLPWMTGHPNVSSLMEGTVCPKCGSDEITAQGTTRTLTAVFQRFQCKGCGGWGRTEKKVKKLSGITRGV